MRFWVKEGDGRGRGQERPGGVARPQGGQRTGQEAGPAGQEGTPAGGEGGRVGGYGGQQRTPASGEGGRVGGYGREGVVVLGSGGHATGEGGEVRVLVVRGAHQHGGPRGLLMGPQGGVGEEDIGVPWIIEKLEPLFFVIIVDRLLGLQDTADTAEQETGVQCWDHSKLCSSTTIR